MVHRGVQALLDAGIKLLALDFDLTICSAHTHGMFNGSADDLRGWVLGSGYIWSIIKNTFYDGRLDQFLTRVVMNYSRLLYPEMVALVQQAAPKLQVAVTTYSPQEELIGQVFLINLDLAIWL